MSCSALRVTEIGLNVEGTALCIAVLSCSAKVTWTADATAHPGVLPMSNMLVCVKGGAAWAGVNYNLSSGILGTTISSSLSTKAGVNYHF